MNLQNGANLLTADLTFFIDTSLEESIGRMSNRGKNKEKFEDIDFLRNLIVQYNECYELGRDNHELYGDINLIDGDKSIKKVSIDIAYYFNKNLSKLLEYQNL